MTLHHQEKDLRVIKITIAYEGTRYHGWQMQKGHISVQEELEKAIRSVTQENVRVIGSGRTDAGVHALGQTAHFKSKTKLPGERILKALNSRLPKDIRIIKVQDTFPLFHARFSARWKTYAYFIWTGEVLPVLERHRMLHHPHPLDVAMMAKAGKLLEGRHDYSSFCVNAHARQASRKDAVRNMRSVKILKKGYLVTIELEAEGFLYKMVRSIVGTLIKVGEKKITVREFVLILNKKNRSLAAETVEPQGLCLMKVKYS